MKAGKGHSSVDDITALQRVLDLSFNDPSLLRQALIHGSFTNENPASAPVPNERLEFLGDAVLGLAMATRLYLDYPDLSEGEMTKLRALLVRGNTLAKVAKRTGLGGYLYLGKGEETSGGRDKPANLARALEAVIGAAYLDRGLDEATHLIFRLFHAELEAVGNRPAATDYKSELQELCQARGQQTPTYHLIDATGPDHDRTFTIEVRLGDTVLGRGSGKSKKAAETAAARSVLEGLPADFTR